MTFHRARRQAMRLARTGWRWWLGELRPLAPARLRPLFDRHLDEAQVEIDQPHGELRLVRHSASAPPLLLASLPLGHTPDAAFAALPALLARAHLSPSAIALRLAPGMVLRRTVSLPAAPPRLLRALLDHEMGRLVPLPATELCFDARILLPGLRGGRMLVELVSIRRQTVTLLLHGAARAGLGVDRIGIAGAPEAGHNIDLLNDPRLRAPMKNPARRASVSARGLTLLLALALLGAMAQRAHRARAERDVLITAARATLASHAVLEARLRAARAQADFLPRQRRALTPAALINEVARLLPDDSVLSELSIDSDFSTEGVRVIITGNSRHATDLIGLLAASKLFTNPRFAAAITAGPNAAGAEDRHFSIAFEAAPRPAPRP